VFDFNDVSCETLATQELGSMEGTSTQGLFGAHSSLTLFFPRSPLVWT
jgi:hypothetical protein